MKEAQKEIEKNDKKRKISKFNTMITIGGLATLLLLNQGISRKNQQDIEYEKKKMEMIDQMNSVQDKKNNFSRLLYPNVETVNGKKYTAMNMKHVFVAFETEFTGKAYMKYENIKNTGQMHLTANKDNAYTMFENGTELIRLNTKNNQVIKIKFEKPLTNISMSSTNNFIFVYSDQKGLMAYNKDLNGSSKVNLNEVKEVEGEIKDLFVNKYEDKVMIMGSGFKHIYFIDIKENRLNISRLKLDSNLGNIEKPRVVKFENNLFIKPENENFIYEVDEKTGKLLNMMEIPVEEKIIDESLLIN